MQAGNHHRRTMIAILWLICTGFTVISSSEDLIEKSSGSNITLMPKYFGDSSGISWWFRGALLADVKLGPTNTVTLYPASDHFRDRIFIDKCTASMTITVLTEGDSGNYMAEAPGNNTTHLITRIRLIVGAYPPDVVTGLWGSSVQLTSNYSGVPTEVSWWRGPHILIKVQMANVIFYNLRGRADMDPSTGHLTIKRLSALDAADYRAEALVNNTIQYTFVKLIVISDPSKGLSGGTIAAIVLGAVLALILGIFLKYKYCTRMTKSQVPIPASIVIRRNDVASH